MEVGMVRKMPAARLVCSGKRRVGKETVIFIVCHQEVGVCLFNLALFLTAIWVWHAKEVLIEAIFIKLTCCAHPVTQTDSSTGLWFSGLLWWEFPFFSVARRRSCFCCGMLTLQGSLPKILNMLKNKSTCSSLYTGLLATRDEQGCFKTTKCVWIRSKTRLH